MLLHWPGSIWFNLLVDDAKKGSDYDVTRLSPPFKTPIYTRGWKTHCRDWKTHCPNIGCLSCVDIPSPKTCFGNIRCRGWVSNLRPQLCWWSHWQMISQPYLETIREFPGGLFSSALDPLSSGTLHIDWHRVSRGTLTNPESECIACLNLHTNLKSRPCVVPPQKSVCRVSVCANLLTSLFSFVSVYCSHDLSYFQLALLNVYWQQNRVIGHTTASLNANENEY